MTTNTKPSALVQRLAGFYKVLALALVAAPVAAAFATSALAEANCPQWSTPVCRHWNLGPPPSCTEWACAADKQSDPPKKVALATTTPVRYPIARPPIVRPGPVSIVHGRR
jgi:hypothetical protein